MSELCFDANGLRISVHAGLAELTSMTTATAKADRRYNRRVAASAAAGVRQHAPYTTSMMLITARISTTTKSTTNGHCPFWAKYPGLTMTVYSSMPIDSK